MGAAFGVCLMASAPLAMAQDDPGSQIIPSVVYESADIREALRALFRTVNVSFTIDPDVQGSVTATLKNVPFDTVLQNLLRQVGATYQVQGGVYRILMIPIETGNNVNLGDNTDLTQKARKTARPIKITRADPYLIALLIGSAGGAQQYGTGFPEYSTIVATQSLGGSGGGGGSFGGGGGGGFGR